MRDLEWFDPAIEGEDPMQRLHRLSEPYTKETWREYVDYVTPTRPTPMDRGAYQELTNRERSRFDADRLNYNASLEIVRTKPMTNLQRRLRETLLINHGAQPSARLGLMVDGETRTGKTTMVKHILRRYEEFLRSRHPQRFDQPGNEYIPIAFVQTPQTGPQIGSALLRAINNFYGMPMATNPTIPKLQDAAVKAITGCRTEVIVFDDLHFLDLGEKAGRDANNLLKALANRVSATFVCVGVELEDADVFNEGLGSARATQTSGRYSLVKVTPFQVDTEGDAIEWAGLIRAYEDQLVLLDHKPGSLAANWEYVHHRTGGHIGGLYNLVRLCAVRAYETDEEAITLNVLEDVEIDHLSESRAKRAPRTPIATR